MKKIPDHTLPTYPLGPHGFDINKSIDALEAEAFIHWEDFIKHAIAGAYSEEDKEILLKGQKRIPFAKAFIPFIGMFRDEICVYLKQKSFTLSNTALEKLVTGLLRDYFEACSLTLYCTIQDEIPDRSLLEYDSWVENFYKNRWPSFTAEYTVLGILLKQRYDQYMHHCCEVFDRLEKDTTLLKKTFKIKIETISDLEFRLADRHNHGRNVCKIEFNESFKIIYKPKPLKNEAWMQHLLTNNAGFKNSDIGQYKILDRGEYGWSEFVEAHEPVEHSIDDIIESYSSLLAVLYLINSSDMHTENAMICGNTFYPIDLETIFNAPIDLPGNKFIWQDYSIFFTGMVFNDLDLHLARPDVATNYFDNTYHHAMYRVLVDENSGVSMRLFEEAKENKEGRDYRPSKLSQAQWLLFAKKTERKILEYKDHLAQDNALRDETLLCRFVPRNTAFYGRIQQVLYHPYKLKNFKDWEEYIYQLVETLDPELKETHKDQIKLINSEISQLKRGDIPYFTYYSTSKSLHADNALIIENFFAKTGQKVIQEKINSITRSDAKEIKNLLVAKYVVWNQTPIDNKRKYKKNNYNYKSGIIAKQILATIENICDIIMASANITAGQPARWISHEGDVSGIEAFHVAGNFSFYNGYWGIMAFLAAAEKNLSGNNAHKIKKFLNREMDIWLSGKKQKTFFSNTGLSGLAGHIKSLSIIDNMRNNSEPLMFQKMYGNGDEIYKALEKKFDDKEFTDIDFIEGKLGLFLVLQNLSDEVIDKDRIEILLNNYYKDILKHWDNYISHRDKALIGFAHGISALAKLLAYGQIGNLAANTDPVKKLLSKVLEYDGSCKVAESGLWSDNRHIDIRPVNRSWCHGMPGIGISRLALLNIDSYKKNAFDDLELILHMLSQEKEVNGFNFLCCGDCGEIDFLIEASRIEDFHSLSEKMLNIRVPALLHEIAEGQFFYGTAGKINSSMAPDLFQGAAGIGYTLLRLRDHTLPTLY